MKVLCVSPSGITSKQIGSVGTMVTLLRETFSRSHILIQYFVASLLSIRRECSGVQIAGYRRSLLRLVLSLIAMAADSTCVQQAFVVFSAVTNSSDSN